MNIPTASSAVFYLYTSVVVDFGGTKMHKWSGTSAVSRLWVHTLCQCYDKPSVYKHSSTDMLSGAKPSDRSDVWQASRRDEGTVLEASRDNSEKETLGMVYVFRQSTGGVRFQVAGARS